MIQIPLKEGHFRPASETSFQWGFADGPLNSGLAAFFHFQGIQTSIVKTSSAL